MSTSPYRTLMHQKRWATVGLNAVLAENLGKLSEEDRRVALLVLDHTQAVDQIFQCNLERRRHGYQAPRSAELPSFDALARNARTTADWYADYADCLLPEEAEESIDFCFSDGKPASMTRGEMLLHVAMHSAGHRSQVALLLQKNGIPPFPDRITDFLSAGAAGAQQPGQAVAVS